MGESLGPGYEGASGGEKRVVTDEMSASVAQVEEGHGHLILQVVLSG